MEFGKKRDEKGQKENVQPAVQPTLNRKPFDISELREVKSLDLMRKELRDRVASDAREALKHLENIGKGVAPEVCFMQIFALKRRAILLMKKINSASESELDSISKKLKN
jgi:hypothetical protein